MLIHDAIPLFLSHFYRLEQGKKIELGRVSDSGFSPVLQATPPASAVSAHSEGKYVYLPLAEIWRLAEKQEK